jgi:RNA-directed DNA polymerase
MRRWGWTVCRGESTRGILYARVHELHRKIHRGTYRAQPSRRVYIPKADGRQRRLGIASLEDKIVQQAVSTVLGAIYEEDFLGFSYGFRGGRGQHDALDALYSGIKTQKVNWILDLDIRGFFDEISHDWMVRFLEHRIADKRLLRLVRKGLKAGVIEDGRRTVSDRGLPARVSVVADARERVPSLCSRSLGASLAPKGSEGPHHRRAVCR